MKKFKAPEVKPKQELVPTFKASLAELEKEFLSFVESVDAQMQAEKGTEFPITDPETKELARCIEESALPERRDRLGWFIERLEAEAGLLRQKARGLDSRAKAFELLVRRIKDGLLLYFQNRELLRVEGDTYIFRRSKNPPSVKIVDESLIPADYYEMEPKLKKDVILDALKRGEEVPGVELEESRERIDIR